MDEFPDPLQQFIVKVVDARDGSFGYMAIATLLGQGEES